MKKSSSISSGKRTMTANQGRIGDDIAALQDYTSSYMQRIETEKASIERLALDIAKIEGLIKEERKRSLLSEETRTEGYSMNEMDQSRGGENSESRRFPETTKTQFGNRTMTAQSGILKNFRLTNINQRIKYENDQVIKLKQKCSITNADNKRLKQEINTIRRERIIFGNFCKELENELKQKEAKMKKLIEAAEETYSQSHLTDLRLEDARQKANKERKIFEQEWQRIQEEIEKRKWPQIKEDAKEYKEEAKKLKDVIGSIQRKIASPGGSLKTPRGLKSEPSKTVFSKKVTSIRPFHKVRTLEDLEREEESERNNLYEKSKELENIEQNIEKLKKETNIATIQGIGESYQIYVEKDAQLAKEVQYLDEEIEKLDKQIADAKQDINKQKTVGQLEEDYKAKKLDQELTKNIEETKTLIESYRKKRTTTTKTINSLKIGIRNIYESIGCANNEEGEDMSIITESNMLKYLGAIEERSNEILQMYDLCRNKPVTRPAIIKADTAEVIAKDLKEACDNASKMTAEMTNVDIKEEFDNQREVMKKLEQWYKDYKK